MKKGSFFFGCLKKALYLYDTEQRLLKSRSRAPVQRYELCKHKPNKKQSFFKYYFLKEFKKRLLFIRWVSKKVLSLHDGRK